MAGLPPVFLTRGCQQFAKVWVEAAPHTQVSGGIRDTRDMTLGPRRELLFTDKNLNFGSWSHPHMAVCEIFVPVEV